MSGGIAIGRNYPLPGAGAVDRAMGGFRIVPENQDADLPVLLYGLGCVVDSVSGNIRSIKSTDAKCQRISARPYPEQAKTATNYGASGLSTPTIPPEAEAISTLDEGFISVILNGADDAVNGQPVYMYVEATAGAHVQGGFEAAAGANLVQLPWPANSWYGSAVPGSTIQIKFRAE